MHRRPLGPLRSGRYACHLRKTRANELLVSQTSIFSAQQQQLALESSIMPPTPRTPHRQSSFKNDITHYYGMPSEYSKQKPVTEIMSCQMAGIKAAVTGIIAAHLFPYHKQMFPPTFDLEFDDIWSPKNGSHLSHSGTSLRQPSDLIVIINATEMTN